MCRFVQLDSAESLRNLPDILDVDMIDGFFFSPGELLRHDGTPDGLYGPDTAVLLREAAALLREGGKPFGVSVLTSGSDVLKFWVDMGASITMAKGAADAGLYPAIAVIGDSTFMHSGMTGLVNVAYNATNSTVIIVDNSITGMTGHQDHAATGKTLMGEEVPAINIFHLCKSLGIKNVVEVNAFDIVELERIVKEEVAKDEVSVIITKAPCVLLNKKKNTKVCRPNSENCKKCGACLRPGCPALTKNEDGTISIDETMCNGCGLCASYCKFGAIKTVARA